MTAAITGNVPVERSHVTLDTYISVNNLPSTSLNNFLQNIDHLKNKYDVS